ncbi:erythropoietin-like [Myxocyprinus asiaticus]|uniref:erythropoietin-like n=1 Tax=Myxocyprinus asiaticus TaxID=70543 RepID=UPI0022213D5E|nr:erythropoietin-like [Myxocyprinus asiaticus]
MQKFSDLVLVLMVFVWLVRDQVSALRPICDLRVLDHFVREAQDSEIIMHGCRVDCGVTKSYFVPMTSVDFAVWEQTDVQEQAAEVQTGLSLLVQALSSARHTVISSPLASTLDNNISNMHSLGQILHSLHLQQAKSSVLPNDSALNSTQIQEISSLPELLRVQSSFLRGKVRLLLSAAPACQKQNG